MRITNTGLLFDDPNRSTPGYIVICPVDDGRTFLLAPDGSVAHEWDTGHGMTNWSYLLPNGNLFRNERVAEPKGVALTVSGRMSEYDPAGNLLWRHDDPYQHHDARRLENGAIFAAFTELSEVEKSQIQGGYPGSETPGGPYGEAIRQVDENGTLVWEWHFTNLGMETHPLHPNSNKWSYGHTNTVYPLDDGTYLISSKNLNLLFILDPKTNAVTWEFQDNGMSGQHDAQMLENGNILIFANGAYSQDLHHSEVWEIDPTTKEVVWKYVAKDDFTSFFSPHMGGAQRLPSGNTLICEGNKGCLFEVTPEEDVVREFVSPHMVQSPQFGQINWLFRCRWYAPESPEIMALSQSVTL
ncbi:arylsulfotransferase family protein [Planktotalea sp.]|uniref:arylsulfotransferase family protein n=1 Tax=Planktotalea sp. TaxID=2029877 RepID=UPI003F6B4FC3